MDRMAFQVELDTAGGGVCWVGGVENGDGAGRE
jgi:hypothetical protein